MGLLDSAIAFDQKKGARVKSEAERSMREFEDRIRAETADALSEAMRMKEAAEARASAAESLLAGERAARQQAESAAATAMQAKIVAEGEAMKERLSKEALQATKAAEPAKTTTTLSLPKKPVAYHIEINRGGDGLMRSLEVTPKGA